jgi:hypothetical protein
MPKGDDHGEQGTKGEEQGKEKEEEREAKAAQEVIGWCREKEPSPGVEFRGMVILMSNRLYI